MKKETAEKAEQLLRDISRMEAIRDAIKEEPTHWWAFISPDIKRRYGDGVPFPQLFRKEFALAVEETITKIEKELEKL